MTGRLVLCATPIGHLGDASPRLAAALAEADVVLSEDTRRARVLLDHLGVETRPESYHAGNEADRSGRLAQLLEGGASVALISDAGTPAVADPGLSAVRIARQVGAEVSVIPGPSAVVAALAVSGLPSERFVFEGFLPRRGKERAAHLAALVAEVRTIVLFSATARVVQDLSALAAALGDDRRITVSRELTKAHEEVWSGILGGGGGGVEPQAPTRGVHAGGAGKPGPCPAHREGGRRDQHPDPSGGAHVRGGSSGSGRARDGAADPLRGGAPAGVSWLGIRRIGNDRTLPACQAGSCPRSATRSGAPPLQAHP